MPTHEIRTILSNDDPHIPLNQRPKLLIVDDQPINIQILHALFAEDHDVFMATSGEQALTFCTSHLPDLILLDILMPGMDGHEVCRRIKADPLTRNIPIIFVSAQTDPVEEAAGLDLGAVDYITKPINAAVVRARVRTHLALRYAIKQLAENERDMERRIAERSAQLEAALDTLHHSQEELVRSEAKATLSTLVASVSHELGTPLGNSLIMAGTLADHAKTLQQGIEAGQIKRTDLNQFLGTLHEGTELIQRNLSRAVDLLKNFKQVAADQASEQRRSFDLAIAVREVIDTLAPSLKLHPHRIDLEIPTGIPLDSYPGALGQVIINLINNAYTHAFEGRSDGVLTIQARAEKDQIHLRFTDNGVGIEQAHLDKLFLPFFSTKIGQGGTGLGMTIVENLVSKTLGGSISVSSTLNVGTTFSITLPIVAPAA